MSNMDIQTYLPQSLATVRFSVRQLAARDELLLKSLIRLLSHRTQKRWVYCSDGPVDVVILGDHLYESFADPVESGPAALGIAQKSPAPLTLAIGHAQQAQSYFLNLPLHANALEQMLNQIGRAIPAAMAPVASVATGVHFSAGDTFRLLRWPPTALLPTVQHRKLATLLSGKSQLLEAVVERSGLQRRECEIFLQGLQRLQLLEITSLPAASKAFQNSKPQEALAAGESPVHWRASLGLVARIRNRLGLSSSASSL